MNACIERQLSIHIRRFAVRPAEVLGVRQVPLVRPPGTPHSPKWVRGVKRRLNEAGGSHSFKSRLTWPCRKTALTFCHVDQAEYTATSGHHPRPHQRISLNWWYAINNTVKFNYQSVEMWNNVICTKPCDMTWLGPQKHDSYAGLSYLPQEKNKQQPGKNK